MWSGRAKIQPLGDSALLVRFGTSLDDAANRKAISLAAQLQTTAIDGVVEVVPSLVSVLVRYDPLRADMRRISGELALCLEGMRSIENPASHTLAVTFDGPDLAEVAEALRLSEPDFVAHHNARPLRVLATGFAPGFVYCGFHAENLVLPRRSNVRPTVPAGSVLFAAGQTAVAATEIPTGWHWIGHTDYRNFEPANIPPTLLGAGDLIAFETAQ